MITKDQLINKLKEILEIDDITLDTDLQNCEDWHSITAVMLYSYIYENYNIKMDINDYSSINTVQDLIKNIHDSA